MSALQMVCHLSDSFRMAIGEKAVSDVGGALKQTVVKCIALYLPMRWPTGLLTRPEVDQEGGGTPPLDFAADVAHLTRLVELISADTRHFAWRPTHPMFGRMSEADWLRWSYLHMDHHLRQFGV